MQIKLSWQYLNKIKEHNLKNMYLTVILPGDALQI